MKDDNEKGGFDRICLNAGGFEDRASFGYGDKVTVYLEGNLFFFHSSRF